MNNLKFLVGVAFSLILTSQAQAMTCDRGVPLWCRGPLTLQVSSIPGCKNDIDCGKTGYSEIHFNKNATGAGANGEKLRPGSCAWPARPFYATENGPVAVNWTWWFTTAEFAFQTMKDCSDNEKCAFAICAVHDPKQNVFHGYADSILRTFPY